MVDACREELIIKNLTRYIPKLFFYSFLCLYLRVDDDDVHVLFTQYTLHVLVSIGKHYIVLVVKNVEVLLGKGECNYVFSRC